MQDLQLAREMQQRFDDWKTSQKSRQGAKKLSIDLTLTVLTTGYWPTYKVCPWLLCSVEA